VGKKPREEGHVGVESGEIYKLREKNHINAIVLNMLVNNASALVAGMVS
jgi:hypothetical protein